MAPVASGPRSVDPGEREDALRTITLDKIEPRKIDWLWPGFLALGHLSLVAGDPGQGKSILTLDLAARISRGMPLPGCDKPCEPGRVLLLNAEDGQEDTLRPRAEAAGADLTKITVLDLLNGGRAPQLPGDAAMLDKEIEKAGDVQLVVLDPINACIPMKLDAHKDQHVRQALSPLVAVAQRRHVAVALVCHLNKASDMASALHRISGSTGIGGAARSVIFVGPDPDDEARRIVAQGKPQLGPRPDSLGFKVIGRDSPVGSVGVIEWLGAVDVNANELVAKQRGPQPHAREQAMQYIRDCLRDGPKRRQDVVDGAEKTGLKVATIDRAKQKLGVVSFQEGREAWWSLPA